MAGVFARTELDKGVHKAPGNEVIRGASGVALDLREDDLGQLNAEAINAIRVLPGRGVRVWSARTLSDDINWRYLNVRRLFIMLRRAIEQGTQWAVFESNEPRTWETLSREVGIFLERLWQKGAFAGPTAADSFYVVCDRTTNTPERVDAGQLLMEIGVAPTLPAEYLILHVVQKSGSEERAA
jgi:phage tail sheath protein FI